MVNAAMPTKMRSRNVVSPSTTYAPPKAVTRAVPSPPATL
jgi:hypothetical protein